ncbi:BnaA07g07860D [Brassica napus]|uniref:BnaA07g07860D protein n=1 Tax=Brassica napus TaxID=3708 RepID=A0A078I2M5_BRANA|nr:BnaA07g07860D [Brassica napus]
MVVVAFAWRKTKYVLENVNLLHIFEIKCKVIMKLLLNYLVHQIL